MDITDTHTHTNPQQSTLLEGMFGVACDGVVDHMPQKAKVGHDQTRKECVHHVKI